MPVLDLVPNITFDDFQRLVLKGMIASSKGGGAIQKEEINYVCMPVFFDDLDKINRLVSVSQFISIAV